VPQFRGAELVGLELSTPRLLLRPWRPGDAPEVAAILATGRVQAYAENLPSPYTGEDARRFVTEIAPAAAASGSGLEFAVVERGSGALSGAIALRLPLPSREASIGYWIAPTAWRQGFATEAVRALAQWGGDHGVARIEITCNVRNTASAKVALRSGFTFEGLRRDAHAQFSRLATDSGEPVAPAFVPLPPAGLADDTIVVRVPSLDDLPEFAEQEEDDRTVAVGVRGAPKSRAAMAELLARSELDWLVGRFAPFALVDRETGRFAGSLHLRRSGPPEVGDIGFAVHPAFRGRGYATRALRLVCAWAFEYGGFERLELGTKVDNTASQRSVRAAGFIAEGVATRRLRNADGSFSDELRFGLLRN
jgi:RimJ/RimL family protein N-acetyltransferase